MTGTLAARLAAVATGVWLMFAPWVLDYGDPAATNDRIVGPIAGAFAFVACWDVMMAMRWATLPCGAWMILAAPILGYGDVLAWVSTVASGIVFVATAFVGEDVRDRFGGGWRSVRPSAWTAPPT
jgi:hypothetical protein